MNVLLLFWLFLAFMAPVFSAQDAEASTPFLKYFASAVAVASFSVYYYIHPTPISQVVDAVNISEANWLPDKASPSAHTHVPSTTPINTFGIISEAIIGTSPINRTVMVVQMCLALLRFMLCAGCVWGFRHVQVARKLRMDSGTNVVKTADAQTATIEIADTGTIATETADVGTNAVETINSASDAVETINSATDAIETINSGTSSVETVNSDTNAVETINSGTSAVEAINSATDAVETINSTMDAVETINSGTDAVETINSGTSAVEAIDCATDAVETINSATNAVETINSGAYAVEAINFDTCANKIIRSGTSAVVTISSFRDAIEAINSHINVTETINPDTDSINTINFDTDTVDTTVNKVQAMYALAMAYIAAMQSTDLDVTNENGINAGYSANDDESLIATVFGVYNHLFQV